MRFKKFILSGFALAATLSVAAQETKTEYVYSPNWYMDVQMGAQYTLGEAKFGDLVSPTMQLSGGYNFNKTFGLRLGVNGYQAKAAWDGEGPHYEWKWNYITPALDATVNLSNAIWGYNPDRLVDVSVFAGLGCNIAFNNDEAQDVNKMLMSTFPNQGDVLRNLWDGTKARFLGRIGAMVDFRLSDHLTLGVELQANTLNDNYNSKKSDNSDWYFNGFVGLKYHFGKNGTKKAVVVPVVDHAAQAEIREKAVQEVVVKEVVKEVPGPIREIVVVEPLRHDIYFTIRSSEVSLTEMQKVKDLAAYLKKYPEAKIEITGHADKGTGNPTLNMKLSQQRAKVVADALVEKCGIDRSRITTKAMGDTDEPHEEVILNRVSVCIAK